MIARREALLIVAGLLARRQPQTRTTTCAQGETLVLDLGSQIGCPVQAIKVQLGAVSATIPVADLLSALGAKLGGDE
jgi:hypothetical protein